MPRLLLVEDYALFRGALAFLLNREPGLEVAAQVGSVAGCRALGGLLKTMDAVVLDPALPDGDGADLIGEMRGANPGVKVLILTASIESDLVAKAEALGADGLLTKAASLAEIADEVERLAGGGP